MKQRSSRAIWKYGYSHTDDKSQKIQKSVNDRAFPVERDTSQEHSIIYVISIKQDMTWTLRKNLIPTCEWKPRTGCRCSQMKIYLEKSFRISMTALGCSKNLNYRLS